VLAVRLVAGTRDRAAQRCRRDRCRARHRGADARRVHVVKTQTMGGGSAQKARPRAVSIALMVGFRRPGGEREETADADTHLRSRNVAEPTSCRLLVIAGMLGVSSGQPVHASAARLIGPSDRAVLPAAGVDSALLARPVSARLTMRLGRGRQCFGAGIRRAGLSCSPGARGRELRERSVPSLGFCS